jgi:flagellar basal-body rod modification protein FlgD
MKKTTGLNKDDFMQLFITQLKNQDPLNPTDSSAMVAQMAQLTQVEQAYNTNTNLQNLLSAINSQSNMTAVSYIGKTITAQGSQIQLTSGVASQLGFSLPNAAEQVQVTIADASGKIVRVLNGGTSSAGERNLTWDGLNGNGVQSPSGTYTFAVTGFKSDGSKFDGTPLIKAVVTGVKMDQGSPVLQTGGIDVPLANVTKVGG